ncbi:phosphate acetyltransferase [Halarsenatibacter silvermanii]|uniref:Phosphate acetyltransferase n=1 Tax=Halarsenatibacter silvermanii TaxID=321763 RepID=A0A1G9NTX9_9FIRM|nr:phosphate acetyltransferase [Halarsenatibacter silvermanii]SDL89455.1 phosphotransacetylase [Halarsenatibacter silvermanii]
MDVIGKIREKARNTESKIVLPEAHDERILKAAEVIIEEGIADLILLGEREYTERKIENLGLDIDFSRLESPEGSSRRVEMGELLFKVRRHKGLSRGEAYEKTADPLYYGTLLVESGHIDGLVAGADNPTGKVLKPALQIIKTEPGIQVVSGAFIMVLNQSEFGEEGLLVMADCAVNPEVNHEILGEIAVSTAETAKDILGITPRVAMLSFSTAGSASHELVDKVKKATERANILEPGLKVDGELQVDAALIPEVAEKKAPDSEIAGEANVLIFPDLQSGNIGYKLVQRLAGAEAVGPVLQGIASPVNDLSRGCSVENIINLVAITAIQADKQ